MPGELIPIVMFMSFAAVLIFRPLTKKLGAVLEQNMMRKQAADSPDMQRVAQLMEQLVDRMDRLEERVDFAERMLESSSREREMLLTAVNKAGLGQEQRTREGKS